jgi:hypothetical protein
MAAPYSLYLDHEKFGCGARDYVAMQGRKWVRVVELATGNSAKISTAEFLSAVRGPKHHRHAAELRTARVCRRLRKNAKVYGNDQSPHVKAALKALRASL